MINPLIKTSYDPVVDTARISWNMADQIVNSESLTDDIIMEDTGFKTTINVVLEGPLYNRAEEEGLLTLAQQRSYECFRVEPSAFIVGISGVGDRIGRFNPEKTEILVAEDSDIIQRYLAVNPDIEVLSYEEFKQRVEG